MNTEQNYVGGGNFATTPPQMDATASKTSPSPDDRQVRDAQTRLLKMVDDFCKDQGMEPIRAVNDLLNRWLTTPVADLSLRANRNQLSTTLALVEFLAQLNACNLRVELDGKEVNNEN